MSGLAFWEWIAIFSVSVIASLAVLVLLGRVMGNRSQQVSSNPDLQFETNFLFHKDELVDCSNADTTAFSDWRNASYAWADLKGWLSFRFDGLPETLSDLTSDTASFSAQADQGSATLIFRVKGTTTHVTMRECKPAAAGTVHEQIRNGYLLNRFEQALNHMPVPVWLKDRAGDVIWRNQACDTQFQKLLPDLKPGEDSVSGFGDWKKPRISVTDPRTSQEKWFEMNLAEIATGDLHYAQDITKIVRAEAVQREFMQTMTKTFANLEIGLAVFDQNRQLAMFNPALVDLTGLPARFLSARPGLMAFFDMLRDQQVMPEPKNYASWRARISELVVSASGGTFQETWSLPQGITFRVSGRPHPNGSVAYLFEDISADISLTRRFRAQLDIRQNALDMLDTVIAVLSADDILLFCNQSCRNLLGIDPEASFAETSARDLIAVCADTLPDPEFWATAQDKLRERSLTSSCDQVVATPGGDCYHCTFHPLAGGNVLLTLKAMGGTTAETRETALA